MRNPDLASCSDQTALFAIAEMLSHPHNDDNPVFSFSIDQPVRNVQTYFRNPVAPHGDLRYNILISDKVRPFSRTPAHRLSHDQPGHRFPFESFFGIHQNTFLCHEAFHNSIPSPVCKKHLQKFLPGSQSPPNDPKPTVAVLHLCVQYISQYIPFRAMRNETNTFSILHFLFLYL